MTTHTLHPATGRRKSHPSDRRRWLLLESAYYARQLASALDELVLEEHETFPPLEVLDFGAAATASGGGR